MIRLTNLIYKFNNIQINKMQEHSWDYSLKVMLGEVDRCDDADIISKIAFSKDDRLVAIGDHCGRLIIFQQGQESYDYITQLQAYKDCHDWQKNREVSPQVNFIQWLTPYGQSHKIVTANEKYIKIWRMKQIYEHNIQAYVSSFIPTINEQQSQYKSYKWITMIDFPNLHQHQIKNVSISQNEQFILSADKDTIYKWNFQKPETAVQLFQKQQKCLMEDQVFQQLDFITSIHFHPFNDNIFCYTTKEGTINQIDTRISCKSNNVLQIHFNKYVGIQNDFTQFLKIISDFDYTNDNGLICRDYLYCYLWDLRKTQTPAKTMNIYPPVMHFLSDLIEDESILDQFKIVHNKTNGKILTSHYQNCFHEIDMKNDSNKRIKVVYNSTFKTEIIAQKNNIRTMAIQSDTKIQGLSYGNSGDKLVASSKNCGFFFNKKMQ